MLPSSLCRLWQPDRAANAAQDSRSYTTAWGTIPGGLEARPGGRKNGHARCRRFRVHSLPNGAVEARASACPGTADIAAASSRSERRTRVELGWFLRGVHVPNVTCAHCGAPVVNCEFTCDRCREKQPLSRVFAGRARW